MIKNKNNLLLLLIVAAGALLRFWGLARFPVSLNWDEVSHGYNAYSVLLTGKDEWGVSFPTIFRAFGDYKLPIYIYLTIIPVWLFGLTPFAVRFISALAGVIAIPLIYLLANEIFSKSQKKAGLLAALLLAISPWHFFLSRPALEANLALTFIIAGTYFFLRGLNNSRYYLASAICYALSLHTYNTARVFVPLLIVAGAFIYRKSLKIDRYLSSSLVIFLLSFCLVISQVLAGTGTARYQKLAILTESSVFQIGENRARSHLPGVIARLAYNRPVYFSTTFVKNYLSYFSPAFFNQSHGAQTQFAIPGENLFTYPVLIFALLGFVIALKNFANLSNKLILVWLMLSPVAAATTIDPPQALRPNPLIPAVILLAVYGLLSLPRKHQVRLAGLTLLLTVVLFVNFLSAYFGPYQKNYSPSWQYGYRQAVEVIKENLTKYDRIIMTKRYGEPHIYYAFYGQLDPKSLQPGSDSLRFAKSDWFWTDKIGKVYFVNDWEIPTKTANILRLESGGTISTNNSLLITSPDHVPANTTKIDTINFTNGDPAFVVAKFN